MMKRISIHMLMLGLLAFTVSAQNSGVLQINVTNQSGGLPLPAQGLAIFYFDDPAHNYATQSLKPEDHDQWKYTNSAGDVAFSYSNKAINDTLAWAAFDCSGSLVMGGMIEVRNNNGTQSVTLNCLPAACDAFTHAVLDSSQGILSAYAITLIDSTYTGGFLGQQINQWVINGGTTVHGNSISLMHSAPGGLAYCYKAYNSCSAICDSAVITGSSQVNPISCDAFFMVDTLTPVNGLGEIIILESSLAVAPAQIVSYNWDFGDGTSSNAQYPSHTYTDTNIYEICLTITATNGSDSCISTYCDSIGYDMNGTLVYKNTGNTGFGINVIDPATVGTVENFTNSLSIYPNPTQGKIYVETSGQAGVLKVQVIDANGSLVSDIKTTHRRIDLDNIPAGYYLVKIVMEDQTVSLHRLIIK